MPEGIAPKSFDVTSVPIEAVRAAAVTCPHNPDSPCRNCIYLASKELQKARKLRGLD